MCFLGLVSVCNLVGFIIFEWVLAISSMRDGSLLLLLFYEAHIKRDSGMKLGSKQLSIFSTIRHYPGLFNAVDGENISCTLNQVT